MLGDIDRFINWLRRRNPDTRTWKDYRYDLNLFVKIVGNRPPGEVKFQDIDRFVSWQVESGFKPTTINRRLAAVSSLYTFLSDEDEELMSPVLPHRHHLREPRRLPRPVPMEDLRKFFAVIENARDRAMFILMLRCGLRISEVAQLLLTDLYLDEKHPRMVVNGKGSHERSVYLSAQAKNALLTYLDRRPSSSSEKVFISYLMEGMSTTAIHKRLMRYREKAGVELTAHRLRHSFANDLLAADVPVTSIQKLLGHRWLETTQNYVMANDRQVQDDFYAACQKMGSWGSPEAIL